MRVGIVGLGVIGKRLADAVARQPDLTLVGVAVRSLTAAVYAQRHQLAFFASEPTTAEALRGAAIPVSGDLDDLIAAVDVVVDAGTARTGASRAARYSAAGVDAIYCGGERDTILGPLVHSAMNYPVAVAAPTLRVTSCNTTALARLVAAVGVADVIGLDATILRCATDSDKAGKGITNGAVLDPRPSHHAPDLRALAPNLDATSLAATLPMTCGHAVLVRLRSRIASARLLHRLSGVPRITLLSGEVPLETAALRAVALRAGRRWAQRFELVVQPCGGATEGELALWLSLDNESITIPETLDVLRARSGQPDADAARAMTDRFLPVAEGAAKVHGVEQKAAVDWA